MKGKMKKILRSIIPQEIIDIFFKFLFNLKNFKSTILKEYVMIMKKILPPDPKNRYLNIGGGLWYYPRWENIDYYRNSIHVDYNMDLRENLPLPFKNNCVIAIFTSHCLEHLPDENVIFLLNECYRILKPKGILRISVPDMDKAFTAYNNNDLYFFERGGGSFFGDNIERKLVNFFASYKIKRYSGGPIISPEKVRRKVKTLNKYDFARWCVSLIPKEASYRGHVNTFDFDKLKEMLKSVGFVKVIKSEFRSSKLRIMKKKKI